eukprot:TRINITY_DN2835_c0_g1_i2.p1 TRINITY_DN2835_c0_g1~~TRINITY_DN2835_c0_g1_i2.p1  ORF type:complete len:129 (+),score=10.30 TRINITY_DN2835_c0_g1_i2:99-485(+)
MFDIDMDDYNDIRACCKDANICNRCWPFMTIAIKVIDNILRSDFGFEHILWVYSGRRGVHCWVSDPRAKVLTVEGRSAILSWISDLSGGIKSKRVNLSQELHPTLNSKMHDVDDCTMRFWNQSLRHEY